MIEKPILNGRTDKENLHILETWAGNIVDRINYQFAHLDNGNIQTGYRLISESDYQQIQELIKQRAKGE